MKRLAVYRSIACITLVWPAGIVAAAPHSDGLRPGSVRYFHDADGPKARLADGREYRLLPVMAAEQAQPNSSTRPNSHAAAIQSSLPNVVDHRQFYDAIRDQGDRGTCVAFATVAAVEGVYRRVDPQRFARLHLSEQWTNHMLKMVDRRQTSR